MNNIDGANEFGVLFLNEMKTECIYSIKKAILYGYLWIVLIATFYEYTHDMYCIVVYCNNRITNWVRNLFLLQICDIEAIVNVLTISS